MKIYGVIMAGGGGTRFWPLSRKETPKQLLNLSGKDLMINETIDRITCQIPKKDIFIVTNATQKEKMIEATKGRIDSTHILCEAAARNTAACVGFAAITIVKKYGDGIMCVFPADHFIKDEGTFSKTLGRAIQIADESNQLVTMGISPTYPSTGYGYIKYDNSGKCDNTEKCDNSGKYDNSRKCDNTEKCDNTGKCDDSRKRDNTEQKDRDEISEYKVIEFKEKPDLETAKSYLESGQYAWNSGMFVWKASVILEEFRKYLPDIYDNLKEIEKAYDAESLDAGENINKKIDEIYKRIRSISIDYGIMEQSDKVVVIPAEFGWSDVGSFDNLGVMYDSDDNGNIIQGNHIGIETKDCIVYAKNKLIATIELENIVVVETDDTVLVCKKDRVQDVKKIVEKLAEEGKEEFL